MTETVPCTYVIPVRWTSGADRASLTAYLRTLARLCDEVIVVDGSPPPVFAANAGEWSAHARHVPPEFRSLMGKVAGVTTGVRLASNEFVVIADDDVRYGHDELRATAGLLARHDLVRPQNYFDPLPWHARWDTGRTLLNRALGSDYPGTLAVRRSRFVAMGGYDGDVLFENLELIRTVRASGGSVASPPDLYVRRLPPSARHFWSQRVRQAYDDLAIPLRMATWLAVVPAAAWALVTRRFAALGSGTAAVALLAERGRRRAGGSAVFPSTASALAPLWVFERAVCAWIALGQRVLLGGTPYHGRTLRVAANPERTLRARRRRQPRSPEATADMRLSSSSSTG